MDYKNLDLKELQKLSKNLDSQIKTQISIMDETFDKMIKELPNEEASKIENFKGVFQRSMNLVKEGKTSDAQDLIKSFDFESLKKTE